MTMMPSKNLLVALLSLFFVSSFSIVDSGLAPISLGSKPALAGGISDWLPVPTGIYFEINGKKFYFGDYSADPTLTYPGSKWEVKVNGRVWAHGYGETPGWLIDTAKRVFGF